MADVKDFVVRPLRRKAMDSEATCRRNWNPAKHNQWEGNDLYHEMTDRVSLEQLDLICKALDCKISDLLVQEEDLDDLTRSRLATPRCRSITSDK